MEPTAIETTVASEADELYAKAMLNYLRRGYSALDDYAKDLPNIPGKDDLGMILAAAACKLEEAAEAIASALDEASCDSSCPCTLNAFHRKLRASSPEPEAVPC